MTQTGQKLYTFKEFIEWYPENSTILYELHRGVIVEIPPPTGDHTDIISFLIEVIPTAIKQCGLTYRITASAFVKTPNTESAYLPDLLLINRNNLSMEPLWKKQSTLIYAESIPLVVEIISNNWQDDYYDKVRDYESMGIPEYWIVDYAALGGRRFIGNPKQPTFFVCELIDGEYQITNVE